MRFIYYYSSVIAYLASLISVQIKFWELNYWEPAGALVSISGSAAASSSETMSASDSSSVESSAWPFSLNPFPYDHRSSQPAGMGRVSTSQHSPIWQTNSQFALGPLSATSQYQVSCTIGFKGTAFSTQLGFKAVQIALLTQGKCVLALAFSAPFVRLLLAERDVITMEPDQSAAHILGVQCQHGSESHCGVIRTFCADIKFNSKKLVSTNKEKLPFILCL